MDWLLPAVRPVPPLYAVRVAPNAKKGTGRGNSRAVESGAPDERHVADGKSVWSWHRCWCEVGERRVDPTGRGHVVNSPATVARRIRRRGELAIIRKTIAWGMPDVSGASAVNTRVLTHSPQRTRGCGCIGHPAFPVPSVHEGDESSGNPRAHPRREIVDACHTRLHVTQGCHSGTREARARNP